jgi:hypothetical protein
MIKNTIFALGLVILGLAGGTAAYSTETFSALAAQCVACGP